MVQTTAVLQTTDEVVQGRTAMEAAVCMVLVLLAALLAVVLALFGVPPFSQSMNRMSFPGVNHKHNSFCRHV